MKEIALKLGVPVFIFLALVWLMLGAPPQKVGYAPEQPIHYSHKVHAGDYNIDCQYCHTGVSVAKKAGVPSLNVCNNCHQFVTGDKETTPLYEELQKLVDEKEGYLAKKESPEWIRIHNMPDHVKFSHAPHIKVLLKDGQPSKEACAKCHGDVATMDVVAQQETLNMGFCINCHRENKDHGARTNCSTCHY